jgi:hypothetical protein
MAGVATPEADILEEDTLPVGTRAGVTQEAGISAGCTLVLEIDLRGLLGEMEQSVRMPRANRSN